MTNYNLSVVEPQPLHKQSKKLQQLVKKLSVKAWRAKDVITVIVHAREKKPQVIARD